MSLSTEPTVAERLAYVDRLKAEARQFADKIKHRNREYRRTRAMAALMVAEAIGVPYSEEKLRKSGAHTSVLTALRLIATRTCISWRRAFSIAP